MNEASGGWRVGAAPGRGPRRVEGGLLELPLHVLKPGRASLVSLVLTMVEAEQLHAALCDALGDEPAPVDAPECRQPVRYPGGRQKY
ncbi:hypothetical protein VT50_0214990 [Streptomyces antioxidans]|uniref:Uncharacterized protein n=1 Tax=Streptomyces antioxidans TaxID=1507734 RepID=A0A1V4D6L7_9ACTN|nr:hypothetical protein VT50_0214990 [Streptomyces antioxidans]